MLKYLGTEVFKVIYFANQFLSSKGNITVFLDLNSLMQGKINLNS